MQKFRTIKLSQIYKKYRILPNIILYKIVNNMVNNKIKLDKNFTENSFNENKKLYQDVYLKK